MLDYEVFLEQVEFGFRICIHLKQPISNLDRPFFSEVTFATNPIRLSANGKLLYKGMTLTNERLYNMFNEMLDLYLDRLADIQGQAQIQ